MLCYFSPPANYFAYLHNLTNSTFSSNCIKETAASNYVWLQHWTIWEARVSPFLDLLVHIVLFFISDGPVWNLNSWGIYADIQWTYTASMLSNTFLYIPYYACLLISHECNVSDRTVIIQKEYEQLMKWRTCWVPSCFYLDWWNCFVSGSNIWGEQRKHAFIVRVNMCVWMCLCVLPAWCSAIENTSRVHMLSQAQTRP